MGMAKIMEQSIYLQGGCARLSLASFNRIATTRCGLMFHWFERACIVITSRTGLDPPWSTRDAYIQCEADFVGAKMGAALGSLKHYPAITKHGQAGSRFVLNRHRCSASCLLAPEVELQAF